MTVSPSEPVSLRSASRADRNEIVAILCDAFRDDPVYRWVFRNPRTYEYWLRASMRESTDRAFSVGHVIVANVGDRGELTGVALWYPPPGHGRFGWQIYEPSLADFFGAWPWRWLLTFDWAAHGRNGEMDRFLARIQPTERLPYWYLAALAVKRTHQRRGIGTALLREGLARAISDQLPVCLRSWEHVIPFYERYRFASVRSQTLPGEKLVCHALVWMPPEAPLPAARSGASRP
jgi:GNAT superfamily N-acetyltransferase